MREQSPKQTRILEFIRSFIDDHDYPPSIRQIQEACDISSTSVVDYNLRALEKGGHIRRDRDVSRGIELVAKRPRVIAVPIIGTIAAGQPIPVPSADAWREVQRRRGRGHLDHRGPDGLAAVQQGLGARRRHV